MTIDFNHCKLIYTGFCELYVDSQDRTVCYKKISKTGLPPPHNSKKELEILKTLTETSNNNKHIIEFLGCLDDFTDKIDPFYVFKFKYYEKSLDTHILKFWNPVDEVQKRKKTKFNFTTGQMEIVQAATTESASKFTNNISESQAIAIFYQLVDGLEFIHSQKIIHRDIKPQNVLVSNEGVLKIIDFDVSYDVLNGNGPNEIEPSDKITDVSTSIYKAPELLFGIRNYDYGIDIWSLMILVQHFALDSYTLEDQSDCKKIKKLSKWKLPSTIDNGTEINYEKDYVTDTGSDIRLITSIFENFKIPSLEKWPSVDKYGSKTFEYMFAGEGSPDYLDHVNFKQLFPKFNADLIKDCIIPMCVFEQTERITARDLKNQLQKYI